MNSYELKRLKLVLVAQSNLIDKLKQKVDNIEIKLENIWDQASQIEKLNKLMDEIESDINFLNYDDVVHWNDDEIKRIYIKTKNEIVNEYKKICFDSWEQFVRDSYAYCLENNLDATLPWEAYLSKDDIKLLNQEDYALQYKWNKWDYIIVGSSGILASLIDYFWVAIPKTITTGVYAGQRGSVITEWLNKIKLPPSFQKWLENVAKVPYDNTGGGDHRIDTFGHDPVLGFIIGTIDIMRGLSTRHLFDSQIDSSIG